MSYKKASECLPESLIREVQKYVAGELIYFPAKEERKSWGSANGTKEVLRQRNQEIIERHACGEDVWKLAENFCLSADSIRKILKNRKEFL